MAAGYPPTFSHAIAQMSLAQPHSSDVRSLQMYREAGPANSLPNDAQGKSLSTYSHLANLLRRSREIFDKTPRCHSRTPNEEHNKVIGEIMNRCIGDNPQSRRFECHECGKSYATRGNLTRHKKFECNKEANATWAEAFR